MSFLGILIACASIILANIIEGGNPLALIDIPAFFIIGGATFGAMIVQFPPSVIAGALKQIKWALAAPKPDFDSQAALLKSFSQTARQSGLLALENQVSQIEDKLTRSGVQMIVDGVSAEEMIDLLDLMVEAEEYELEQRAKVFEAAGGYAPCMGIVGAVLGLIHAMGLLDQPDLLGPAIGVAFIATIYGVTCANAMLLPLSNRFKAVNHELIKFQNMTIAGLSSIVKGETSVALERRLNGYMQPKKDKEGK